MVMKNKQLDKRGFIILFSMLVSSTILLMSTGVFNLVQKELVLSSYARESQRAFYAADAALECALFWDVSDVATTTGENPFILEPIGTQNDEIRCNNELLKTRFLAAASSGTDQYKFPYIFRYSAVEPDVNPACAYVLIEKELKTGAGGEVRITAVGFNVCVRGDSGLVDTPDFNDPRLLEQRLSITYVVTPPAPPTP